MGCFQIRGRKQSLCPGGVLEVSTAIGEQARLASTTRLFFHYTVHMHSYYHFITVLQTYILGLIPRATRAGLVINQCGFKERNGLFTGACALPHAVTCFWFVLLHVFCSQTVLQASHQISGLEKKCRVMDTRGCSRASCPLELFAGRDLLWDTFLL